MTDLTIKQILDALPERSARYFQKGLDLLPVYEADTAILKIELTNLRQTLNSGFHAAWDRFIREPFLHDGRWEKLTEAEKKLVHETLGLYPEVHTAAGYLKRVLAAKAAEGIMYDTMYDVLSVLIPIAERAQALKDKIGKRPPAQTKTSMERAERDAKAMHCQICARDILAETGLIAHHGYQRPTGTGYQTPSCPGAKEVPYEVSRDALGGYIKALEDYVIRTDAFRSRVQAETTDITWHYSDRSTCTAVWHRGAERSRPVNRANFAQAVAETKEVRETARQGTHYVEPDFDRLKKATISSLSQDITSTEAEIDRQRARWHRWVQTHERKSDQWVAVEV